MAPYTKLAVRSLGPTKAVTREEHAKIPTYVPASPSRGSRLTERVKTSDRWWERALCQGDEWRGRRVWIEPHKHPRSEVAAAVALCARCPVRAECAADDCGWCIQGGVAHVSKPAETQPRPKRLLVCEWCAVQFSGMSRKFCSDGCRRAHHRDKQRKTEANVWGPRKVQTGVRSAATLGLNINEADDATTTSRPRPLTDLSGGPL